LDRFTILLLITTLAMLVLVEAISFAWFDRTSRVQSRELAQRRELLSVRDASSGRNPHLAVTGNSLLLEGVDVPALADSLHKVIPVPYFVLGTEYFDWYFGLKRLFAEGTRPRYIVLGLSPNQLTSFYTRGNYSARYLFQQSDLLEVARRTHMDPTSASGFFLAHFSEFYSTRDVTRGFLMNRMLPSVAQLLHSRLSSPRQPTVTEALLRQLAPDRVSALSELCRASGSRLMLAVPPTYEKGAGIIAEIGNSLGVPVLVPVPDGEFDSSCYQADGFHMNDKGARIFTSRLATQLNYELLK
jgi:hypothetical protein